MKSLIQALTAATVLTLPIVSLAQSPAPLTRAKVRAELVQLEHTGWRPGAGADPHYPEDIQAAEATVAAMDAQPSGYGGTAPSTSQAGRPSVSKSDLNAMYSHP